MSSNWMYVAQRVVRRGEPDRLVALFRSPRAGGEDEVLSFWGWRATRTLWAARAGRHDDDFREIGDSEAEQVAEELLRRGRQNLAGWLHTMAEGFELDGSQETAASLRKAADRVLDGTLGRAELAAAVDPDSLAAEGVFPADAAARARFEDAWEAAARAAEE